ncbi:MAG: hypothetical protein AAFR71_10585 [Pseudomonadota bacterium]
MTDISITEILSVSDASELTEEQVRYFKKNPELLELVRDRETLGLGRLWRVLWIAAALVAASKLISVNYGDEIDQFALSVASDLVFEMGAALIGSVATVIFIQYQEKRQFQENMKFRADLNKRIEMLD